MGSSGTARSVAVVFVAVVSAVLVAFFAAGESREARAQTTATPTTLTPEDLRVLDRIARDTRLAEAARARGEVPTASMEEAQAKSRRVLSTAMRRAYLKPVAPVGGGAATGTSITPVLMRAGLAGLAAGIWVNNGVMIYNGIQCGEAYCPPPIKLDAQFLNAGRQGAMVTRNAKGQVTGTLMMTRYEWDYSDASKYGAFQIQYTKEGSPEIGGINTRIVHSRTCDGFNAWFEYNDVSKLRNLPSPYRNSLYTGPNNAPHNALCVQFTHGEIDGDGTNRGSVLFVGPPAYDFSWENPVFSVREVEPVPVPGYAPGSGDYVPSAEQNGALIDAIRGDPEYDPAWAKPWLREDFLAPQDAASREALWGPVIGTWTTPGGGECKEFESGAKICDFPGGSTFVWIVEDRAMWMQSSNGGGDGNKDWTIRPSNLPSDGGVADGGPPNEKPEEEIDEIIDPESDPIARHVVEALEQGDERHRLPGVEPANSVDAVKSYIEQTIDKVEFSEKRYYYETDELDREVLSGPYYSLYASGEYAGQYKKAYWDAMKGVVIIRDPAAQDGGSAFKVENWETFRKENFPNTWHDRLTLEQ